MDSALWKLSYRLPLLPHTLRHSNSNYVDVDMGLSEHRCLGACLAESEVW